MLRRPTRKELTILRRTYDKLGCFEYFNDSDKCILIREQYKIKEKEVYLASKSAGELALSASPTHVGLFIGRLGKRFTLSLEGTGVISRVGTRLPFVAVNETGERLVLYGRDLFGQSIIDASPDILASQFLAILNSKRESIAVGRARVPTQRIFEEGSITVNNLIDAGYYLRLQSKGIETKLIVPL